MNDVKREKHGRGNQKAVYASMGNVLEIAENQLEERFSQQTALIAIKAAQEMTKVFLAEVIVAREQREMEQHKAVIKSSKAGIRKIENKMFDELKA
jgi:hypothetical protein